MRTKHNRGHKACAVVNKQLSKGYYMEKAHLVFSFKTRWKRKTYAIHRNYMKKDY